MSNYQDFLEQKRIVVKPSGFTVEEHKLNPSLFDFQQFAVKTALAKGKYCLFAGVGLGKTLMQLEWSFHVAKYTGGKVLILAPLAVTQQTVREGEKFGISVKYVANPEDIADHNGNIFITNYEKLARFDASQFAGVVLDESSCIKHFESKTTSELLESFASTPYKLACTATPAPNDYMELGNHSEWVGALTREEMLAMFFTHDGGKTSQWRLKKHAQARFWEWVASWSLMFRRPGDLGFTETDKAYVLPNLEIIHHTIETQIEPPDGALFFYEASSLSEQRHVKKQTLKQRCEETAKLVNPSNEQWLVWCDLNDESKLLTQLIPDAVEVKGSDSDEHKEQAVLDFTSGKKRVLISKPSMFGFGLNLQNCHNMAFVGLNHSWESFHQTVGRCYRFGQKCDVTVYLVYDKLESAIARNLQRKQTEADEMAKQMVNEMAKATQVQQMSLERSEMEYKTTVKQGQDWTLYLGDCVEITTKLPDNCIHLTVTSIPFANLYVYSSSVRDIGNCTGDEQFAAHFDYLVEQLYRITIPGRLCAVHLMNLPTLKSRDGYIGLRDFRGDVIRMFQSKDWIYHSEVCIWKNPVQAMQRTKALGLLHKQVVKDSAMSRQGIPDTLVVFRKPGNNPEPITGELTYYAGSDDIKLVGDVQRNSVEVWQRYASPVWMDINPSDTLTGRFAKEDSDERHIAPLQLQVIERSIQLWSNPGDLVLDPFNGIGSTGYQAIKQSRKYLGIELKESYFNEALKNMGRAEKESAQGDLFAWGEANLKQV